MALGGNCVEQIKEALQRGARVRAPLLMMATQNPEFKDRVIDKVLSQAGFEFDPNRRSFEATNFGHAKLKGNEVIAQNAFEALIANWPEISARAKRRRQ